jgi:MSHA pilin protein MshD
MCSSRRQAGLSLIEVVVFIIVLGIAFVGMIVLFNSITRASVDPVVRKQAVAIASSLLEEIELRAFTYCDPDDTNVGTANSTGDCTGGLTEIIGPNEPGANAESRYAVPRFDNVNDYHGFSMAGANIRNADNQVISAAGLTGFTVNVTVANITAGELLSIADVNDALRITVTVDAPAGVRVSLQGYRLRYAPRSP